MKRREFSAIEITIFIFLFLVLTLTDLSGQMCRTSLTEDRDIEAAADASLDPTGSNERFLAWINAF
jgi:hypothetical protein